MDSCSVKLDRTVQLCDETDVCQPDLTASQAESNVPNLGAQPRSCYVQNLAHFHVIVSHREFKPFYQVVTKPCSITFPFVKV